jgi:sugar lactone lactonase YvrE
MARSTHRASTVAFAALGLLVLASPSSAHAHGLIPILNPKEYVSPSGDYRLYVDPSHRYGGGKAKYRLTKKGVEVWAGERPFTLWQAGVDDDGTVGGYAYTHGPTILRADSEFRVVLLDPKGNIRLEQTTPRAHSRFPHMPPNPVASDLIFDPPNDRMVVRVADADANRRVESWWVFRLSTAKPDGKLEPKTLMADPEPARYVIDARPVADTPLTLLHWWRYAEPRLVGARFTLIDLKGKPVWTLDLPRDYMRPGDEKAEDAIRDEISEHGAILDATQPGRFDLRFAAEGKRVTFTVRHGADGKWEVKETGRQPYVPPAKVEPKFPELPDVSLKYLGAVTLRPPRQKPAGAIRDIRELVIDGKGRLAFLRWETDAGGPSFVLVDQAGAVIREVRLGVLERKGEEIDSSNLTWVGGDRFLVTRSPSAEKAKAIAWWVDAATGKVTEVKGFDCPPINKLAGFPDGRFVALATDRSKTHRAVAHLFDAEGRRVRDLPQGFEYAPGALYSPDEVMVTSDGTLVFLETIGRDISLFTGAGKYLKTIDLAKAWKRKPNYPSHLAADVAGGIVVGDFNGPSPIVRMKADGTVRQELSAKYPDGRTSSQLQDVRVAPDGTLWATDGEAIVRLDANGVADRVLGSAPDPDQIDSAWATEIDARGRIYTAAARTGAVHVFDSTGKHLHVCRPNPTDFPKVPVSPKLSVADTGDVYVSTFDRTSEHLHFSPDGKRLGFERLQVNSELADDLSGQWLPRPGGAGRWVLGYQMIGLADAKGAVTRTIERDPGGNWLESSAGGAVGPDGSLAVLSASVFGRVVKLHLYDKSGLPVRTLPLPPSVDVYNPLAYDGERVAIWADGRLLLLSASGRPVGQFRPPQAGSEKAFWRPFLPAARSELWLHDGRLTVHRYSLPK